MWNETTFMRIEKAKFSKDYLKPRRVNSQLYEKELCDLYYLILHKMLNNSRHYVHWLIKRIR